MTDKISQKLQELSKHPQSESKAQTRSAKHVDDEEAVSYTHLDVYKRQIVALVILGWEGPLGIPKIHIF